MRKTIPSAIVIIVFAFAVQSLAGPVLGTLRSRLGGGKKPVFKHSTNAEEAEKLSEQFQEMALDRGKLHHSVKAEAAPEIATSGAAGAPDHPASLDNQTTISISAGLENDAQKIYDLLDRCMGENPSEDCGGKMTVEDLQEIMGDQRSGAGRGTTYLIADEAEEAEDDPTARAKPGSGRRLLGCVSMDNSVLLWMSKRRRFAVRAWIWDVAVIPQARRSGIGSRLLAAAEKHLMEFAARQVNKAGRERCDHILRVIVGLQPDFANEPLLAFYKKQGYQPLLDGNVDEEDNPYFQYFSGVEQKLNQSLNMVCKDLDLETAYSSSKLRNSTRMSSLTGFLEEVCSSSPLSSTASPSSFPLPSDPLGLGKDWNPSTLLFSSSLHSSLNSFAQTFPGVLGFGAAAVIGFFAVHRISFAILYFRCLAFNAYPDPVLAM